MAWDPLSIHSHAKARLLAHRIRNARSYLSTRTYLLVEGKFEVVVNGDLVWSQQARGKGIPMSDKQVRARTCIHT